MVPIIVDSNGQVFDQENLKQFIVEKCSDHHETQRALAFAFLVYDFQSAAMRKILKDKEYWEAINDLSGTYLSIFYIDSKDGQDSAQKRIDFDRYFETNGDGGTYKYMTPFILRTTPLDNFIAEVSKIFDIKESFRPPFIVFFQTNNLDIIDSHFIALKAERIE